MLAVPSAVVPEERSYLVNPTHPDVRHITTEPPRPVVYDPRQFR